MIKGHASFYRSVRRNERGTRPYGRGKGKRTKASDRGEGASNKPRANQFLGTVRGDGREPRHRAMTRGRRKAGAAHRPRANDGKSPGTKGRAGRRSSGSFLLLRQQRDQDFEQKNGAWAVQLVMGNQADTSAGESSSWRGGCRIDTYVKSDI